MTKAGQQERELPRLLHCGVSVARIGQRGRAKRECSGRNLGGKLGNRRCEVDVVLLYPALETPPRLLREAQKQFDRNCALAAQRRSPAPELWRQSVETGTHRYSWLAGWACPLSWQCARNCGPCPPLPRMSSTASLSNGHRERIAVRKLRQKSGPRAAESTAPTMKAGTSRNSDYPSARRMCKSFTSRRAF